MRSTPWFLLVMCLAGLLLARESRQPGGSLAGVDRAFLDWLQANAGPAPVAAVGPVTLVELDDSIADAPGRLPLTPLEYAGFLRAVRPYQPVVVGLVPVLDWVQFSPGTEEILLEQTLRIPRLLLAARGGSSAENARDPAGLPTLEDVGGSRFPLAEFPEIIAAPDARLRGLAAASGADNLPGDPRAPVRDVPLVFRHRERIVPGFALETLALALRLAPSEVRIALGSQVQFGSRLRLPLSREGRALLDLRSFGRINRVAFDDLPLLESGQASPAVRAAAERMRGGVILLGRTDRAARTFHLADGRAVSPAEVFAWSAASLSQIPPVHRAGWGWDAALTLGAATFAGTARRRLCRSTAWLAGAGALTLYALSAVAAYASAGLWLPLALPLGLALVAAALRFLLPPEAAL